jgi:hypothetical protein
LDDFDVVGNRFSERAKTFEVNGQGFRRALAALTFR